MAGYKGHLTGAVVFFAIYIVGLFFLTSTKYLSLELPLLQSFGMLAAMFALCVMFGLWPDVDTNSKGQDIFYTLFFLVDVIFIATERYKEAAYLGLFSILPILGKHRGWTHTYWAMVLIPSPLFILPYVYMPDQPYTGLPFYGAAVTGYLSHLFMDGLVGGDRAKSRKRARRYAR